MVARAPCSAVTVPLVLRLLFVGSAEPTGRLPVGSAYQKPFESDNLRLKLSHRPYQPDTAHVLRREDIQGPDQGSAPQAAAD